MIRARLKNREGRRTASSSAGLPDLKPGRTSVFFFIALFALMFFPLTGCAGGPPKIGITNYWLLVDVPANATGNTLNFYTAAPGSSIWPTNAFASLPITGATTMSNAIPVSTPLGQQFTATISYGTAESVASNIATNRYGPPPQNAAIP